jgi:hypothetical protein
MYKFSVTTTVTMTEEALIDHLVFSGASMYPWWRTIELTDDGCLLLEADQETDFEGVEDPMSKTIPLEKVVSMLQSMLDSPTCSGYLKEAVINDDFDSDIADIVLQTMLFGVQVFG